MKARRSNLGAIARMGKRVLQVVLVLVVVLLLLYVVILLIVL